MSLQAFVLKVFCPYCMAAHILGLAVSGLIFSHVPLGSMSQSGESQPDSERLPVSSAFTLIACGLACVGLLAGGVREPEAQVIHAVGSWPGMDSSSAMDQGHGPERRIFVMTEGLKTAARPTNARLAGITLRPAEYPMLGSIDAVHILVELSDYIPARIAGFSTDSLSKSSSVTATRSRWSFLPTPLESKCNPHFKKTDSAARGRLRIGAAGVGGVARGPGRIRQA